MVHICSENIFNDILHVIINDQDKVIFAFAFQSNEKGNSFSELIYPMYAI